MDGRQALRRMARRPSTAKQAGALIALGVDRDSIPWDRAEASKLIERLRLERAGQLELLR